MRGLGAALYLAGCAGTAYVMWSVYRRGRPADVLFAVLAPALVLLALVGLLLVFVPDFFS